MRELEVFRNVRGSFNDPIVHKLTDVMEFKFIFKADDKLSSEEVERTVYCRSASTAIWPWTRAIQGNVNFYNLGDEEYIFDLEGHSGLAGSVDAINIKLREKIEK